MRVVYNSFNGRYSDSPRAVYEAVTRRGAAQDAVWLVDREFASTFPADVATVPIYTDAAVEALESADLVVSNGHLEMAWIKKPGATYVQMWHGTPLKRIHADALGGPPGLLEHLSLDVDRWDVLLSPNPYSTETMRRAFRWSGEILETGYPRNDILRSAQAGEVRERLRRKLHIEDGRTAVLYTPTWRDDAFWDESPDRGALALDVERFTADLGDDHVLLARLHYKITGMMRGVDHPAVVDVSAYPDVADLYLAADALVTDYSSTMFDFAVTGKPELFYAYDLDRYRDQLRGFYFDLSVDPPGPLSTTTEALIADIRRLPEVRAEHQQAYARFQDKFCPLDDGHATDRFLERFFGASSSGSPRPATPDSAKLPWQRRRVERVTRGDDPVVAKPI
ncbi:MAG: CDP-glycerol:poly(glycerophosphate) glycerophosphotransferase [uncultured Nocardioidaceae bacterium]|uniref:CDP-glycerol:poly(Glycerophosphate) glycerophosphotransferase n=1 Tax=uncultured Nocardioidaceae bacterium TaxID=253824 RepID=A0A6J4LFW7_9ACTN|nr:MAG: CDP-glycerol:poly(glycerophosphate) glycerophosphotransferase [uncultured Nocardioidaceae bacterium]